jgi:hypothetical protein
MDARTRDLVRQRASWRCEYCRFPEHALPYLIFHVDHIIAKQHLDIVSDDPDLLAWACSECNYHKGPNLVGIDPLTMQISDLFNPRRDSWIDHFLIDRGRINGRTPTGRATARLLNMNAPRLVRLRSRLADQGEFEID